MKRPLLLLPLLALAAVQCLAQDHATNGLVGARAHLEACGFWDATAYAAAEAHGPAAAAAAPRPAVTDQKFLKGSGKGAEGKTERVARGDGTGG